MLTSDWPGWPTKLGSRAHPSPRSFSIHYPLTTIYSVINHASGPHPQPGARGPRVRHRLRDFGKTKSLSSLAPLARGICFRWHNADLEAFDSLTLPRCGIWIKSDFVLADPLALVIVDLGHRRDAHEVNRLAVGVIGERAGFFNGSFVSHAPMEQAAPLFLRVAIRGSAQTHPPCVIRPLLEGNETAAYSTLRTI
jgi:hypothetical protein